MLMCPQNNPGTDNLPALFRSESPYSTTMASFLENTYSLLHVDNTADQPTVQELKLQLEKGNDETKLETMRTIVTIMLNGDPMPQILMHIIRFVMPSKSKALKKLLYFFYEICPKHDASGKLKQEMILVW
jgi:coatomer subunit beta